jgi:hypothetical protein
MVAYDHTSADHPYGTRDPPRKRPSRRHRRSDRGIHKQLDHQFDDYHDEIGTGHKRP